MESSETSDSRKKKPQLLIPASGAGFAAPDFSLGILNSLSSHICALNAVGDIIALNHAWQQFWLDNGGVPGAFSTGVNYFSVLQKAVTQDNHQDAARAAAGIKKVLAGELDEFEMEYDCHSPDEQRWFLMRVTPLQFQGNNAVVSHINITAKKLAEEELAALYSISREVKASLDLDRVTDSIMRQIAAVTKPDICLLFLRSGDNLELKGKLASDPSPHWPEFEVHHVGDCLCGLAAETGEAIFSMDIHQDARCTYRECKAAGLTSFAGIPLSRKGEVLGIIGLASFTARDFSASKRFLEAVATDVSIALENALLLEKANQSAADLQRQLVERKQLEEQLVQAQKMEAIGALATGVAHEINNPLAGILQNIQLLKRRLLDSLPQNQEVARACDTTMAAISRYLEGRQLNKIIRAIEESGDRAAKIVRNLLDFSRKEISSKGRHDVRQLLDKALELAQKDYDFVAQKDFRKINIVKEYACDVPSVSCNSAKIQQVFLNLLKNAADAIAEKSYQNEQPHLILRTYFKNKAVYIEIEDNGPGMSEETKARIFEPFFTTKPVGKGTGLGLSVSYYIVTEDQGGTLLVESVAGYGTKFIISLPSAVP